MLPDYFVGLDLGQVQDFTALVVVERFWQHIHVEKPNEIHYAVRHLERFKLGTSYPAMVAAVSALLRREELRNSTLVVDGTGVGRPVVDLLRQSVFGLVVPVTITGGTAVTYGSDGFVHVPKKELVGVLQVLLQGRRLKVAKSLPEAETLSKELQNFKVKITVAANEVFGNWREGIHDDLVLAAALACWQAERQSLDDGRPFVLGSIAL